MKTTASSPEPTLLDLVPGLLRDLLMREAALLFAHQAMINEITSLRIEETDLQSNRPAFLSLRLGQSGKFEAQLKALQSHLAALTTDVQKLNKLIPVVAGMIDRLLEDHLREESPAYTTHLITVGTVVDWKRLAGIFGRRFQDCQLHLRGFRTVLMQGAGNGMVSSDLPLVKQKLSQLIVSAEALDAEIDFLNGLGAKRQALMQEPSGQAEPYARVNFRAKIEQVATPHKLITHTELTSLGFELETGCTPILRSLTPQGYFSGDPRDQTGYHADYWTSLRMLAYAALDPNQVDALVMETKALLESGRIILPSIARPHRLAAPMPAPTKTPNPVVETAAFAPKTPAEQPAARPQDADLSLREEKIRQAEASLDEREAYLVEIETTLLCKLQLMQEEEAGMEQRAEELKAWENRLLQAEAFANPPATQRPERTPTVDESKE